MYIAPIVNHGNSAQKEKWVSEWAASRIGCFGLSEPGNGSDAGAAITTAVETADGFRLNGTKMWITNAYEAEASIVFATTDKSLKHKVGWNIQSHLCSRTKGRVGYNTRKVVTYKAIENFAKI